MAKALFLPSHVGLGHVARDLAIARQLRRIKTGIDIVWCTAEPALSYLSIWGEKVLNCKNLESFSKAIEEIFEKKVRSPRKLASYLSILERNYKAITSELDFDNYDLIFADEFWEIVLRGPHELKRRIAFGTDIVFKPYSLNPIDSLISFALNKYFRKVLKEFRVAVLLNSLSDIPNTKWFVLFGEHMHEWIKRNMIVAGLTTSYTPDEVPDRIKARKKIVEDEKDKLIVLSVGGTSARNNVLVNSVVRAVSRLHEKIPQVKLTIVAGPRTRIKIFQANWIRILDTVRTMLYYYVAADVLVVRPGRTTTADIYCLAKPAVLVPITGHFEHLAIVRAMKKRGYIACREDDVKCIYNGITRILNKGIRIEAARKIECRGTETTARLLSSLADLKTSSY